MSLRPYYAFLMSRGARWSYFLFPSCSLTNFRKCWRGGQPHAGYSAVSSLYRPWTILLIDFEFLDSPINTFHGFSHRCSREWDVSTTLGSIGLMMKAVLLFVIGGFSSFGLIVIKGFGVLAIFVCYRRLLLWSGNNINCFSS